MSQTSREPNSEFDAYAAEYDAILAQGNFDFGRRQELLCKRSSRLAGPLSLRLGGAPTDGHGFWLWHGLLDTIFVERICAGVGAGGGPVCRIVSYSEAALWRGLRPICISSRTAARKALGSGILQRGFSPHSADDRSAAINSVYSSLRPGGLFAFWENNPWNPGTRYIMSRIPFDRDAITLSSPAALRLLREGGFEIIRTDFLFFFPKCLSWLRSFECRLKRLPLGAQYQILCRKPN